MAVSLAAPLALPCELTLKNRLMKSAMSETLGTPDARVTPELATLYGRWAQGGTGLLVTGNVMVDRRALGEPGNVALEDARDAEALAAWARAGTAEGTALFMQLNHPGRQSPRGLNRENVAPSAVPWSAELAGFFPAPRALAEAEIEDIVARFGAAARLAREAGFTGVQLHGAHGYLVSQFLSPHTNRREDRWGGSLENRMRFPLEVYRRIRAEVGPAFPVALKLNSADFQKGGFAEDEALAVVEAFAAAGVDLIEISGGTYEAPAMSLGPQRESTRQREAYFLEFAERARARVRAPLALTGGFRTRAGIDAALASGAIDVAGLARALALDPDFANRLLAGEAAESPVRPVRTGIGAVDRGGLMEPLFYARQLKRIARGEAPRPDESPLKVLASSVLGQGVRVLRTRLRA